MLRTLELQVKHFKINLSFTLNINDPTSLKHYTAILIF